MNRLKALIRKFFGFSRTETNGFLILIPMMVVILYSEPAYRGWKTRYPPDLSKDERHLDSLIAQLNWTSSDTLKEKLKPRSITKFSFDPNHVTKEELVKLGLPTFLAGRLVRYREKGGVFRKKEDLLKMYGLDSAWYASVESSIHIEEIEKPPTRPARVERLSAPQEIIDINTADSLQLLKVYGIGPSLSKRIRAFRERLGGFVSMNQLAEVYGVDSAVVHQLKTRFFVKEDFQPRKIELNTVPKDGLRHPYIKWKEADAILSYRRQHGNFNSLDELMEVKVLTREWIEKITPYLIVE